MATKRKLPMRRLLTLVAQSNYQAGLHSRFECLADDGLTDSAACTLADGRPSRMCLGDACLAATFFAGELEREPGLPFPLAPRGSTFSAPGLLHRKRCPFVCLFQCSSWHFASQYMASLHCEHA